MLTAAVLVFMLTAAGMMVQERLKVPVPMTIIGIVIVGKLVFGASLVGISDKQYDHILLMLLPLLILSDALHLKLQDLKDNAFSLTYLAAIAIAASVGLCVLMSPWILPHYELPLAALVALFCMLMATDPIAVAAVFGSFRIPHRLKVLAEGESLLNDATAIILFSIAVSYMTPGHHSDTLNIAGNASMVIIGALFSGAFVGLVGLYIMSLTKNPMIETCLLLLIGFGSFLLAEHFHWSGILSTIVSALISNEIIVRRIRRDEIVIDEYDMIARHQMKPKTSKLKLLAQLENAVIDKQNHEMILQNIGVLATFGLTILFISMADLISIDMMLHYWKEILAVFVATMLARTFVMGHLMWVAGRKPCQDPIKPHWWAVISAAGVKGGVSILMLHMLPGHFEYKELFEAVVIGNILLSTYILPLVLFAMIKLFSKKFEEELLEEDPAHH
ncbi:cation:proton antiporter [Pseudomonas aeruginosa]